VATMHPNELIARREIELLDAGDFEDLDDLYADLHHVTGSSADAEGSNDTVVFSYRRHDPAAHSRRSLIHNHLAEMERK
jgi:hypothetical protein